MSLGSFLCLRGGVVTENKQDILYGQSSIIIKNTIKIFFNLHSRSLYISVILRVPL
jgi:hypothetical protein